MTRFTRFALLAAGLLASLAAGQPLPPAGRAMTPNLTMYMARCLGESAVQKELKLSTAQVEKVVPLAQSTLTRFFAARTDEKKFAEITQEHEKALAAALQPEQVKRLKQVVYQRLARGTLGRVLVGDAALVKHLGLTAEQQKQLLARTPLPDVLTTPQKQAWTALVGAPFDALPASSFPSARRRLALPQQLHYLEERSVAADLKLTEEQRKQIEALIEKGQQNLASLPQGTAEERLDGVLKSAHAVLTPAQAKRLAQIILQQSLAAGRNNDVYYLPQVTAALQFTDGQIRAMERVRTERRQSLLPLFVSGEEAANIEANVKEHKAETQRQLKQVLTDAQRKSLEELIGPPFVGVLRRARAGFAPAAGGRALPAARGGPGGPGGRGRGGAGPRELPPLSLVLRGLRYTGSPDLHKELNLSAEQVKKLSEFREQTTAETMRLMLNGGAGAEKQLKERASAVEKELATVLKPEQLARFKQIVLQQHEQLSSRGSTLLCCIVEVRKGLALTDAQQTKLQQGKALLEVIDEKQKKKWKEMVGKPFTGELALSTRSPASAGVRAAALPPTLAMLQEKSVQEDLQLGAGQVRSLEETAKKYQESYPSSRGAGRGRTTQLRKHRDEADQTAAKLLDEKQHRRLDQILLQQTARQGLAVLLADPAVETALTLSDRQKTAIATLEAEDARIRRLARVELSSSRDNTDNDLARALETLTRVTEKKLNESLTGPQQTTLKNLLGSEFKGTLDHAVRAGRGRVTR